MYILKAIKISLNQLATFRFSLSLICAAFCYLNVSAQLVTTNDNLPLEQLIQDNFGQNCVEISNITSSVNGSSNGLSSYGSFERSSSDFPFENGIILTTGSVNSAGNTLNTSPLNEGDENWGTDVDLENALGITETLNATSIQFNFVSVANQIQFNYLLASEEYQQEYPCFYSDGFAFLIREANSGDSFTNIALIPGTTIPVNTSTIHDQIVGACPAENEIYFQGYNVGDTNFNGRTVVLSATASIIPNTLYEIKLVIADQDDENFDSAVFIEGNSFNATVDLGPDIATCGSSVALNADIQNNQASYLWYQNDVIIAGATNSTYEATASGTYKVEVTIQLNETSCVIEDTVEITLNSEQSSSVLSDFILCDDAANDGVESFDLSLKNNEVLSSVPPSSYTVSYHLSANDANTNTNPITNLIQNTSSPQAIFVRIEDTSNGCLAFSTFNLIVNEKPEYNEPDPIIVCEDPTLDGYTFVDLSIANSQITGDDPNHYVTYHFSQPEADLGINPIFSPYPNLNISQTLYVRIYDALTGCFNSTTIEIELQDGPDINQETQWINSCEQDEDGFENFDLTSVVDNILQGLTGLGVSFHESLFDAQNNLNPISNPENYQNIVPNFQVIYIRVYDEETGCYTVTELELHANIIQTGFDLEAFIVCDDLSNDGIADFDLNEVERQLEDGYTEFETQFYLTETDRENASNPINKTIPFTVTDNGTTIYATVVDGDCIEYVDVVLEISPAIVLEPVSADYCDDNNDGFTTLLMETFDSVASQGVQAANVKYYLTEEDAINNENILPDYLYNNSNPQLLYIRVTNAQTGCYDISTLEVNIVGAPQVLYPEPIVVCDDDNDGIFNVNLETQIADIIPSTVGFEISFYNDYFNAFNGENEISNPQNYNTSTQYIYARVEDETTGCFSLSGFYVYINTVPEFVPISNYENCEADIAGIADFYFYLKDSEILNGQQDKFVLYYESETDALTGSNPIDKYAAYQNTSSPQTIYVRIENFTDSSCFGVSSFELEVGSIPIFNPPANIFVCDDISNDGVVNIDLNAVVEEITEGSPETLEVSFHNSEYDANNNLNSLPLDYFNSSNPQELFARVDNGNYCLGISAFSISVIAVPTVNPSVPIEQCDDNYDGIVTWDLSISEIDILDVRQNNIEVSYFESEADLELDINPILNPENYQNTTNPQTVFVKINNTISNCFATVPLNLLVNLPPPVNDFGTLEICDNPETIFDLLTVNDLVTDDSTDINFSYHSSLADANTNMNPLDTNYNYTAASETIFVRLTYSTTSCFTSYPFELIINPLPIAHQPANLETCDDVSNDTYEIFNLNSQNNTVLQGQDPSIFSVSYHNTLVDAETGENSLEEDYNSQNNETIFVRVLNTITSCYDTTEFNTIIYAAPSSVSPLILCDTDYDGINSFNLTQAEADLYAAMPDNISILYFETPEDLDSDTNPIVSPESYTNLSNPQTVFIKVFNTSANCYTTIPLDISTNLPPPINEINTFEVCDNPDNTASLTDIESVLVNDTTNVLFSYHNNYSDAETNTNPLATNYNYLSINDRIYIRVEDATTGCFYVHDLILQINPLPIANQPDNIETCDDSSNDGFETFDLSAQTATILGAQNAEEFTVTYYLNTANAETAENPIGPTFTASVEQLIIARIENNTTGCFSLTDFLLIVNPHPEIPQPLVECDTDYDAITEFNLTSAVADLFEVSNPNHVFSYFETIEDLQINNNPINNPDSYTNLSHPQTVYIKIFDSVADCFTYVPLDLKVNLPPATNAFEVFDICETEDNTFDLTAVNNTIVDTNYNVLFSYFSSETDAYANENSLDSNYTYTSSNDLIYARVEFSTTHCYYVFPFQLRVNPLPLANQPEALIDCDDDFDGLLEFDLSQQNESILGFQNPNNFTITYHNSPILAEEQVTIIEPNSYMAFDGEVITAKLQNNITGCYSLVDFSVIIHPKPFVNIPDQVVCIDNLPLIVSAETFMETDSYLWSTNDTTPQIEITEIGSYSVTVTSEFGCTTTSTFNVTESESATIELTETVDFSDPNNIIITISGIGNYLYILDDGEPQESNIFENVALGYHTVTIIDLNGCAEVTKEVIVIDAPKFFTPNNDATFDTWHIVGIETLPGSIVYIFNRYGKLIKQLNSNSLGWDGTYNGHNMPASDYWFLAEIKQGTSAFEVRGHFALKR